MSAQSHKKKILLIASNSINTQSLSLPKEFRDIEEAIEIAGQGDLFLINKIGATRYKDLRRKLLKYQPNIVHFSGHGSSNGLFLEDNEGQAKKASAKRLVALLSKFSDQLECVIFNACDSEPIAKTVSQYIPYSIGMNAPIGDPAAIEFSMGFYDAIGNKRNYSDAFDFGVNAISDSESTINRSFELSSDSTTTPKVAIPVLFTNPKISNKKKNKKRRPKTSKKVDTSPRKTNKTPFYKSYKTQSVVVILIALAVYGVQFYNDMQPVVIDDQNIDTPKIKSLLSQPLSSFGSDQKKLEACRIAGNAESIIQAAGRGHIARVKACLNLGVNVSLKDPKEWTALHGASYYGHLDTVKLLISRGAFIDETANLGRTPLYLAVLGNHYKVVHYLLSNGANKNKADEKGSLPISRAKTDAMRSLLSR